MAEAAYVSNNLLTQHIANSWNNMSFHDYNYILTKTEYKTLMDTLSWCLSVDFNTYTHNNDLFLNKIKQCYNKNTITIEQYKSLLKCLLFTAAVNTEAFQELSINKQFSQNIMKDYIALLCDTKFNVIPENIIYKTIEEVKQILTLASYVDSNKFEYNNVTKYKGSNDCIEFRYEL